VSIRFGKHAGVADLAWFANGQRAAPLPQNLGSNRLDVAWAVVLAVPGLSPLASVVAAQRRMDWRALAPLSAGRVARSLEMERQERC
jgi:hypothetical protein